MDSIETTLGAALNAAELVDGLTRASQDDLRQWLSQLEHAERITRMVLRQKRLTARKAERKNGPPHQPAV